MLALRMRQNEVEFYFVSYPAEDLLRKTRFVTRFYGDRGQVVGGRRRKEPDDVERLLQDAGIIRHRGKIESTINNAQRAQQVVVELGSLGALVWSYEPKGERSPLASSTPESTVLAKDLKKRGFSFIGPTTVYAFMQAMGIVNDHLPECHAWEPVEAARTAFPRPT